MRAREEMEVPARDISNAEHTHTEVLLSCCCGVFFLTITPFTLEVQVDSNDKLDAGLSRHEESDILMTLRVIRKGGKGRYS